MNEINEKDSDRFFKKVNKTDTCWIWTGYKNKFNYGVFKFNKKSFLAHRFSFKIYNGNIIDGFVICHKCDNPPCVNPNHLFMGSVLENVIDSVNKKRHYESKKTHCERGHEFNGDNLAIYQNRRSCKECKRISALKSYYKRKNII